MDPTTIPPPRLADEKSKKTKSYSLLYSSYLHIGAVLFRLLIKAVSPGTGKLFDKWVTVDTPGLGEGKVQCALCFPRSREEQAAGDGASKATLPLLLVADGGGFISGQPRDGEKGDRLLADKVDKLHRARRRVREIPHLPLPPRPPPTIHRPKMVPSPAAAAQGISVDPSRIAVMGNSAGGNLVTALSLLLSFRSGDCAAFRNELPLSFRMCLQVLLYPNVEGNLPYSARYGRASKEVQQASLPIWLMEMMEGSYMPPYVDKEQIFTAPLNADVSLLRRLELPEAVVVTAGLDALKEEGGRYAAKLEEAGVKVVFREFAEANHGFTVFSETNKGYRKEDVEGCWELVAGEVGRVFGESAS
ncbi:hypothetical protein FQN55_008336 [Onygenales sp. PD_40]|nr:hypothetical protein FQN55_008336 [Onygenales sp. PD_40]KAK2802970.1 hypothetical protein FQN51_003997 [Onygenales sp. PD_10]